MAVVSSASLGLIAEEVAAELGMESRRLESRRFPDGEGYVRVPEDAFDAVRSEPVILVASTFPDSGIIESLLALHALRDVRKGRIESLRSQGESLEDVGPGIFLAVPYFGYARQDKRFSPGEPIAAVGITELMLQNCDGMTILDLHEPASLEGRGSSIDFCSAIPELAEHLRSEVRPDFILSPDKGAIGRAEAVASLLDVPCSYLNKRRIDARTIVHEAKDLEVGGAVVAIVDDMISTGGTICRAADSLRAQGATEVHAVCTHGLFTSGAVLRLSRHVDGVHATNSLPNPRVSVGVGAALARGVVRLMQSPS